MVSQHIKGRRPLNLAAATAYAVGFGVALEEISPRLAREVSAAKSLQKTTTIAQPEERHVTDSQWQLLQDFEMLPDDEKQALRSTLRSQADRVRKIVAEYLGRQGVTGTVSDARVASAFGTPPPSPQPEGPAGPSDYEQHRITQSAIKKVTARKQKVK